jgi:uncharacterized protein YndB with AHSA1/START domain
VAVEGPSADPTTVELTVHIEAGPATVFRYLVDPERMTRWMGVTALLEPRPGGRFEVDLTGRDVAVGEYVAIEPDRRVVFTWGWKGSDDVPPGSTTVEVVLEPDGDDTVLHFRHSGLPNPAAARSHTDGWCHYLERIAAAGSGRDPGPDPWVPAS